MRDGDVVHFDGLVLATGAPVAGSIAAGLAWPKLTISTPSAL